MSHILQDLRFALRGLARHPVTSVAALLSLALGIGANATIFGAIDAVLFATPDVEDVSTLHAVHVTRPEGIRPEPISWLDARDLALWSESFSDLAVYRTVSVTLGDEAPEIVFGELVSGSYFDLLGVDLAIGRGFEASEGDPEAEARVVVLGHDLWQRSFGGSEDVFGQTVTLNRLPFTVIGVAPEGFRGLQLLDSPELWVPLGARRAVLFDRAAMGFDMRRAQMFELVGRLAPGATPEVARQELDALVARLAELDPDAGPRGLEAVPLAESTLPAERRQVFSRAGWILAAVVALLLLVACANLASLLLARSVRRRQEIAVRLTVGAERRRLVGQLLTESAVLGFLGAAAGLVVAFVGHRILWSLRPPFLGDSVELAMGWKVTVFAFVLGILTTLLFGLFPALAATRPDLSAALRGERFGGGVATRRWLFALVAMQVALSVVALVGTGLFATSLGNVQGTELGFEPDGLFLVPVDLAPRGYQEAAAVDFFRRAEERLVSLPGIAAVSIADRPILAPGGARLPLTAADGAVVDVERQRLEIPAARIGPSYFDALGVELLSGRSFGPADGPDSVPVAVINRTLAEFLWGTPDAVGRRFALGDGSWFEVVGVVRDVQVEGITQEPPPFVYLAFLQLPRTAALLHVRAEGDPAAVAPSVRRVLQEMEPGLPLLDAREVSDLLQRATWAPRILAGLLALFGLLALVLAAVGIYGVVTFVTALRTREMGVRMALGADRGRVFRLVVRQGMMPVVAGLLAGLAVAFAVTPQMANLLFDLDPRDPRAFVGAAVVLLVIALAAVAWPARGATTADPATVLRDD